MNSQSRGKVQVWVLIALVFVLGGVTGAAVDRIFVRSGSEKPHLRGRDHFLERMKLELNLTEEQDQSMRAIFEESRKLFRGCMDQCPELKGMRERTDARMKELLTPQQRTKFDEMRARRDTEKNKK